MKYVYLIRLSVRELSYNKLLFFLSYLLLSCILTVSFFVATASGDIMNAFYTYVDELNGENKGIDVTLTGVQYSQQLAEKYEDFESVYPVFLGTVDAKTFLFKENVLEDVRIDILQKDFELSVLEGEGLQSEKKENGVWISKAFSEEYNCLVGDCVIQELSKEKSNCYYVKGIYEGEIQEILIPFEPYEQFMRSAGYYVDHEIQGVLPHAKDYVRVSRKLKKENITLQCMLEDNFKMLHTFQKFLDLVFLMLVLVGAITFTNLCNMIYEKRLSFLMRLKILGEKTSSLTLIFGWLIAAIVIASMVTAQIANVLYAKYVQYFMTELFGGISYAPNCFSVVHIVGAFVVCGVVLMWSMYGLYRKIELGKPLHILEQKE